VVNIAIIIGAGSSIGGSLINELTQDESVDRIVAVGRGASPEFLEHGEKVSYLRSDYSEESISAICLELMSSKGSITQLIICNGILHTDAISPEKRLEDISASSMLEILNVNTVIPLLWLAKLAPLLKSKNTCRVAILSARVGSIEDNRSGGWYSYRASKAALNMLIKTAAIELRRRAPNVKLIAFTRALQTRGYRSPFRDQCPRESYLHPSLLRRHC